MQMMKIKIVPVCLLVLAVAYAAAESCPVESLEAQKSSRYIQITTQSSQLKGSKINFYSYMLGQGLLEAAASKPRYSFVTDAEGKIKTSKLSPGLYYVAAKGPYYQHADLILNILSDPAKTFTAFNLFLCGMPPPSPRGWTPAAEQMPIDKRVTVFRGVVLDLSGGPVADVSIDIVKKGTQGKEHVAQAKSDSKGHFSVELPEGFYIGLFFSPELKDGVVPFEITKDGSGDIQVVLGVRSTTQSVTVSSSLDLSNNAKTH